MARIADLDSEGVTDLFSYGVGYHNGLYGGLEVFLRILKEEQERTKLGFIQYKRIEELMRGIDE